MLSTLTANTTTTTTTPGGILGGLAQQMGVPAESFRPAKPKSFLSQIGSGVQQAFASLLGSGKPAGGNYYPGVLGGAGLAMNSDRQVVLNPATGMGSIEPLNARDRR